MVNWQTVIIAVGPAAITGVATYKAATQHVAGRREARREAYAEFLSAVVRMRWQVIEGEREDNVRFVGGPVDPIHLAEIKRQRLDAGFAEWERERSRAALALGRIDLEGPENVSTAGEALTTALQRQRSDLLAWPDHLRGIGDQDPADPATNRQDVDDKYRAFLVAASGVLKTLEG